MVQHLRRSDENTWDSRSTQPAIEVSGLSEVMDTNSAEFKAAVRDHAKSLGVDPDSEPHLLPVVEEALLAELPDGWEQGETEDGTLYYFNATTEESIWEHPLDAHYRELVQTKKQERASSASKSQQAVAGKGEETGVKPAAVSSVEVYSFDDDSDEETPPAKPSAVKPDDDSKTTSRIASLFPQPVPSFSATSVVMTTGMAIHKESMASSILGGNKPSGMGIAKEASGGFGRDRSWLLDGDDDDDIPTLGTTATATTTTTPFTQQSTVSRLDSFGGRGDDGFGSSKTSFTAGLASRGGVAASSLSSAGSSLPFSSRMYGASGSAGISSTNGSAGAPMAATSVTSLDGGGGNSNTSSTTGSASPIQSKTSPRRGIGTTIKGQFFQEMTTTTTTTTAASGSSNGLSNGSEAQSSLAADLAKVQQLEKKISDLTKRNETVNAELENTKQQLEQARQDAKESNYLKMKANESKTKLAERERDIQTLAQEHAAAISNLQQEIQQLKVENERLAKNQQQQASSSNQEVMDMKHSAATAQAEKSALQKEVSELQQKLYDAQQELDKQDKLKQESASKIAKLESNLERERHEHSSEMGALRDDMDQKRKAHGHELEAFRTQLDGVMREMAEKERRTESVGVLQDTLDRQSKFVKEMEDRNKEIQAKLVAAEDREAAALREVKQREHDVSDITKKHSSVVSELDAKEKQLVALSEKVRMQMDQMGDLESKSSGWLRQEEEYKREKHTAERERRDLSSELKDKSEEVQKLQSQLRKQQDEQLAATSKLQMEVQELHNQVKVIKMRELLPLEKQNEQTRRENERLTERIAIHEKDHRQTKQELATSCNLAHQLQVEVENWKRKEQQQKAQKDMYAHEKMALDKHVTNLEAEHSSYKNEKRLEIEKLTFRMRELESQIAQKDYEILRVEERFTKAEAWRLKEARRVEERDGQLLDVKEELAQLKNRNIEAENSVVIQELRREREQLQHRISQLTQELEDEKVARQVSGQKFHDELSMMQKGLEWQLPQLAAACVNRSSEEWVRKCHQVVKALRDDFSMKALTERNELMGKVKHTEEARDHVEQKYKNTMAECDFLRKEVHRVEDNNKVLLDQLHTIRVYMTQRSMPASMMNTFPPWTTSDAAHGGHSGRQPPPPYPGAAPPSNGVPGSSPPPPSFGMPFTDFSTINHLNTQLGILHAQFQQLFDATERRPPGISVPKAATSHCYYSPSERFEIPSSPPSKHFSSRSASPVRKATSREHSDLDQTMDVLLDQTLDKTLDSGGGASKRSKAFQQEKENLISTLESIGVPSAQLLPVFASNAAVGGLAPSPPTSLLAPSSPHPDAGIIFASGDGDSTVWYQRDYWRRKYQ